MKKNISIFATCILFILILGSCAVSSQFATDISEKAKFQNPPEGKSLVYIYRTSAYGFAVGLNVTVNDKKLASFYPKNFCLYTLTPGKHIITGHGENEDDIVLTTEPNKKYYIEVIPKMGFVSARIELDLHDKITGDEGVQKCRLIGLYDDSLPSTKTE